MRAILAILVGGLMVWMQAAAGLSPHLVEKLVACSCCQCANPACNTQTTVPAPTPSPVVQASVAQRERPSPTPRLVPVETTVVSPAFFRSSKPADRFPLPPLFQRHRVLLI
jgi:hypothetical protein